MPRDGAPQDDGAGSLTASTLAMAEAVIHNGNVPPERYGLAFRAGAGPADVVAAVGHVGWRPDTDRDGCCRLLAIHLGRLLERPGKPAKEGR